MSKIVVGCSVLLLTLCGCGGETEDTDLGPEVCDNGLDDDKNGWVDCDDPACTGGACDTGTPYSTTTTPYSTLTQGVTNPESGLKVLLDPSYDFQRESLTECPQQIGTVQLQNTTELDAHLVVWQEENDGIRPFRFELVEQGVGSGEYIDWTIPASESGLILVTYACNMASSFTGVWNLTIDTAEDVNAATVVVNGSLL